MYVLINQKLTNIYYSANNNNEVQFTMGIDELQ